MTFVPGGAGSMGAGFGAGGTTMTWWYDRPGIGPPAREAFLMAAAGAVAATFLIPDPSDIAVAAGVKVAAKRKGIRDWMKKRKDDLVKMIQTGRRFPWRAGKAAEQITYTASIADEVVFEQDLFTGSIVEENMWIGPGVRFYVP